jgi:uncharacterized protein Usg
MVKILRYPTLITVDVFYYRPQSSILQEFIWQTEDVLPEHPRVTKFLLFWKDNIEAVIQQVLIAHSNGSLRPVDLAHLFSGYQS